MKVFYYKKLKKKFIFYIYCSFFLPPYNLGWLYYGHFFHPLIHWFRSLLRFFFSCQWGFNTSFIVRFFN